MKLVTKNFVKTIAAATAVAALAMPLRAVAAVPGETQIHGSITAFNGKYDMHIQDNKGNIDDVILHQGTIINPIGLQLRPGMRVAILGNQQGDTFSANEIDTPYRYVEQAVPVYPYVGWHPWYRRPW